MVFFCLFGPQGGGGGGGGGGAGERVWGGIRPTSITSQHRSYDNAVRRIEITSKGFSFEVRS